MTRPSSAHSHTYALRRGKLRGRPDAGCRARGTPVADAREEGLRAREVRDLPDPPRNYWRLVGPGIVAGGVGLSSGEFVLWPFIASQVGLILLWGALVGVVTQFFLNMEVERYTLATGETAVTGFNRFWKHWGLVFAVLVYFANLWPGWAISSATLASYLFGGIPTTIAIVSLLVIGFSLTFAPVIYVALERLIFVKVAAVLILVILGLTFAIEPESWRALPVGLLSFGTIPEGLSIALIFGAIAFAGSGGGQNLMSEQLDSRQGIRHGAVCAEACQPHHRRGHGRPERRRATSSRRHRPTWRGGAAGGASRTSSRCSASCS